jgi:hypothetical protein
MLLLNRCNEVDLAIWRNAYALAMASLTTSIKADVFLDEKVHRISVEAALHADAAVIRYNNQLYPEEE